jgi:hypothetical protein
MQIKLNKQLDKQVYLDFREGFAGGVDFGKKYCVIILALIFKTTSNT